MRFPRGLILLELAVEKPSRACSATLRVAAVIAVISRRRMTA
jgi:hypothetical protein